MARAQVLVATRKGAKRLAAGLLERQAWWTVGGSRRMKVIVPTLSGG